MFSLSNLSETQVMVLLVIDTTFGQFLCKYQGNHPWKGHHLINGYAFSKFIFIFLVRTMTGLKKSCGSSYFATVVGKIFLAKICQ